MDQLRVAGVGAGWRGAIGQNGHICNSVNSKKIESRKKQVIDQESIKANIPACFVRFYNKYFSKDEKEKKPCSLEWKDKSSLKWNLSVQSHFLILFLIFLKGVTY